MRPSWPYPPRTRVANDVYSRAGIVVRDFCDAEADVEKFYDALTALLPQFITLYDHIYRSLPAIDPAYPWADGKLDSFQRPTDHGAEAAVKERLDRWDSLRRQKKRGA